MMAIFSPCRTWRYTLTRLVPAEFRFGERKFSGTMVMFIGLNPSTATETVDDPTVRRCREFARQWGFTRMVMTNLFAFRATDPQDMKRADDPIGPDNDKWLIETAAEAGLIVACWGNHGAFKGRAEQVRKAIGGLHCFRMTGQGQPEHPLYMPKEIEPTRMS